MAGKFSSHLRSNVIGYLALFVALSGTAWAATELDKNEVKSKHIGKGQVRNSDLADNSVASPKVANGSLLGEDFAPGQLLAGPQGEPGRSGPRVSRARQMERRSQGPRSDGSPDTPQQVLDKIKQVDGGGSGLDADTVGGIPTSEFGTRGRHVFPFTNCTDNGELGEDCASVTLDLPRAGRVLVTGSSSAHVQALDGSDGPSAAVDDPTVAFGGCQLQTDGLASPFNITGSASHQVDEFDSLALTTVTFSLSQGSHTFTLHCSENDGDMQWVDPEHLRRDAR